jgi:hypothetical protein
MTPVKNELNCDTQNIKFFCHSECRYADCHCAEYHYAEWHYTEWHYAEWYYAECRGTLARFSCKDRL